MASTDALPVPRKNVAYRLYFAIYKNDGTLISGASGLDSEVSKDGAAFADCTSEATEIGSSGTYFLDLTNTEMNADNVMAVVKTSSTGAIIPTFSINPQESGDIKVDVQSLLGTAWLAPGTAGTPDVNVKLWNGLTTVALPLVPTTAGRTLDVSAGGEAGLDWANVGSPTTANALTNTSIIVTQKVDVDTIKTNPVVNGGTFTFPTNATGASTTNITAGTITTVTNLTNAPTAGDFTAVMKTSIGTAVAASAVASVTGNVGGNVTGSVGSVVGAVGSVTGLTSADVGAIKAKTDSLTFTTAGMVDSAIKRVGATTLNAAGTGGQGYGA